LRAIGCEPLDSFWPAHADEHGVIQDQRLTEERDVVVASSREGAVAPMDAEIRNVLDRVAKLIDDDVPTADHLPT
jgi:hypothetical protein